MITNVIELFEIGMDRKVPEFKVSDGEIVLNLGCGNKEIEGAIGLDYPEWDGDVDLLPFESGTVSCIYALHFLEHLEDPVRMMLECQRVLKNGGVLNIVVPYYTSQMTADDLDHKKTFCEGTWKTLFKNKYYNKNKVEWEFEIGVNLIMGIVERNLALFTQLIKV